jgi:hypothetical protein
VQQRRQQCRIGKAVLIKARLEKGATGHRPSWRGKADMCKTFSKHFRNINFITTVN